MAGRAQRRVCRRGSRGAQLLVLLGGLALATAAGALASCRSAASLSAAGRSRCLHLPECWQPLPHFELGRRRAASAMLGVTPLLTVGMWPLGVWAEADKRGWQMRLPPTWRPYNQRGIPGLNEVASRELLLAGDPTQKAEVKVVRIPLATSPRDPQGLGGLALIEYFSTPLGQQPRVTRSQVVDILSKGFEQQPAIFSFSFVDTPSEELRNATKYLRYDFEAARCEGAQVQGVSGKICQRSDNGEMLPVNNRHHAIVSTVVPEPIGNSQVADGLLVGPNGAEVLWVVDVSAPAASWRNVTEQVEVVLASFGVGTEAELADTREAGASKEA
uniref:Uncharacterized protein n=1 Tax=Pyrodinium bahamense TaxID=73915 RepID=A0A7S0ADN9_9DINO